MQMRMIRLIRIPALLILVVIWAVCKWRGADMSPNSLWGVVFMIAAPMVMAFEFYKSSDISLRTFRLEQFTSIVAVASMAFLTAKMVNRQNIGLGDWFVGSVVLIDAWLSQCMSYATALRNIQANVDPSSAVPHGHSHDHGEDKG